MADLLEVNTNTDNAACSSSDVVQAIGKAPSVLHQCLVAPGLGSSTWDLSLKLA